MTKWVESVPNVSEGRNEQVLQELKTSLEQVPGVALLDLHVDPDHHRSVFTLVGQPEAMQVALFGLIRQAQNLIDLRVHVGKHPRVGVVDVVPWIPLRNMTMQDCVAASRTLGEQVGRELNLPVFLYEESCGISERRRLEAIRRGGLVALEDRMRHHPGWAPDFGPPQSHPSAGVLVTGARFFLIAFNVMLESQDVVVAKDIAKIIRTSNGGLPNLKAIGLSLPSLGCVQVSMNLTDFRVTSLRAAFSAVEREAARHGIAVRESELVGMIPQDAWDDTLPRDLKLKKWNANDILEVACAEKDLFPS